VFATGEFDSSVVSLVVEISQQLELDGSARPVWVA
jgi:hypothetical protein